MPTRECTLYYCAQCGMQVITTGDKYETFGLCTPCYTERKQPPKQERCPSAPEIAYNAWREVVQTDGLPTLAWSELSDTGRTAWNAAALSLLLTLPSPQEHVRLALDLLEHKRSPAGKWVLAYMLAQDCLHQALAWLDRYDRRQDDE